jgi:hypothetical protein
MSKQPLQECLKLIKVGLPMLVLFLRCFVIDLDAIKEQDEMYYSAYSNVEL